MLARLILATLVIGCTVEAATPPRLPHPDCAYPAEVVRVIDGDTYVLRIHLGFGSERIEKVRVRDLWATELHDPGGKDSRNKAIKTLQDGSVWIYPQVRNHQVVRSFDRAVADVYVGGVAIEMRMK